MPVATQRPNVYDPACPTRRALDLIANKWTALIVCLLGDRPHRFNELRRTVGGISQKVLTERLRELERDGLVWRRVYDTVPPSVQYGLTPLGLTLHEPLDAVTHWAERHVRGIDAARRTYAKRETGAASGGPGGVARVAVRRSAKNAR
jgi:DNA-binding HxlR family transcriptional regulator